MDDLERAALRALPDSLKHGPTATGFQLDLFGATEAALEAQQQRILEYRERVGKIQDKKLRAAYIKWLDFFQRENDAAREEARTHTRRDEWAARKKQRSNETDAVETLARSLEKI